MGCKVCGPNGNPNICDRWDCPSLNTSRLLHELEKTGPKVAAYSHETVFLARAQQHTMSLALRRSVKIIG